MIFTDDKYSQEYYTLVTKAKSRATTKKEASSLLGYNEKHHVVPESFYENRKRKGPKGWILGDPNFYENLIFVTAREHYRLHWLLCQMTLVDTTFDTRARILTQLAIFRMSAGQKNIENYAVSESEYAFAKEMISAARTGPGNPQYRKKVSDKAKLKRKETIEKNGGIKHPPRSQETIDKLRKNCGHPQTAETRRKISEKTKGIVKSEEHRVKAAAALRGRKFKQLKPRSIEHIEKIAKANRGKTQDPQVAKKVIETKIKNGTTGKGRKINEETRQRMKLAATERERVKRETREATMLAKNMISANQKASK
jgi:hypothetical protein